jgi:hypothetical protein
LGLRFPRRSFTRQICIAGETHPAARVGVLALFAFNTAAINVGRFVLTINSGFFHHLDDLAGFGLCCLLPILRPHPFRPGWLTSSGFRICESCADFPDSVSTHRASFQILKTALTVSRCTIPTSQRENLCCQFARSNCNFAGLVKRKNTCANQQQAQDDHHQPTTIICEPTRYTRAHRTVTLTAPDAALDAASETAEETLPVIIAEVLSELSA